jgi:conjugal transfer mating pair stabilization protein TraG
MKLAVYVFGHGEVVREYFNAIAAMMGSKPYATAIHIAVLMAAVTVIFQYVTRRSLMDILRWMLLYYIVMYVLFIPKVTVAIEDRVNQRAFLVANVPLGIAVLAHYTTALGAALTDMTEANFTLPGDLRYGHSGMVMASRLVSASSTFQIPNAVFNENMQSFVQQCVFYDLLLNKYSMNELEQQDNLWEFIKEKASPARMFPYKALGGGDPALLTCKESVAKLNQDWKVVIAEAQRLYGTRLFPYQANSSQQLARYLPGSYAYLLKASRGAADILQQSMLANTISNSAMRFSSTTDAPAAMQAFITAKAHIQERLTYQTIGERAAHWLPLMKNALEAILYGAFVIVLLLMIFPFGGMVFKHYAFSLVWLQAWSPLYAIINLIVSYYAERSTANLVGKSGLTLHNLDGIFSINADMASLAGYLSLSVPMLAFGLVRGLGGAMSSMAQYMGGLTQSVGSQVAAEAAGGNISVGNTSVDTHSAFNTSANHADTMGRFTSGGMTTSMPGGSSLTVTPDGSVVMDTRGAFSNLGSSINLADTRRASAMQQSELSYQAALSSANSFQDLTSSSVRNLSDFAETQSRNEASGESASISNHSGFNQSVGTIQRITQEFAERNGLTYAEGSQVLAQTYAAAGVAGSIGAGLGSSEGGKALSGHLNANARFQYSRSSTDTLSTNADTVYTDAQNVIADSNYSSAVDSALRATQDSNFRSSSEEGQRLATGLSASLDKTQQARQDMTSNLQQSEGFRQIASHAQENAVNINSNASQAFFNGMREWMAEQPGTNGKGTLGLGAFEKMQVNDPEGFAGYAKQYAEKYNAGVSHVSSPASVSGTHARQSQSIPSSGSLEQHHADQQQKVNEQAGNHQLGQGSIIDQTTKKNAQALQQDAAEQIRQQQQDVANKSQGGTHKAKAEMSKPLKKHTFVDSTKRK